MAVSAAARLRTMPRPVWALIAGTFLNRFGGFVYIFLVLYLTQRGYSAAQAGLAVGAYGVGSVGAAAAGGHLADRLGRRNTILVSMCGSAASMLALSQAQGLPLIVLVAAIAGLTTELYRPASSALLADLIPEGRRVTGFALYRLAINAGTTAGPIVAGFLAGRSFFLLFLGDALTSLLFAAIALVALPSGAPAKQSDHLKAAPRGRWFPYDRRFVYFLAASAVAAFVYMQAFSTLSLQVRAAGFPPAVYGGLLSLNGLLIIAVELPLTSYTQRLAPNAAMALGVLLIGVGFGLTAFASTAPLLALTVLIWTLGEMVNSPVAQAYVADVAPAHLRGRYAGAQGLAWSAGMILAPVLGVRLFSWDAVAFWLLCGMLGAGAALGILMSQRPVPLAGASFAPSGAACSPIVGLRRRRLARGR